MKVKNLLQFVIGCIFILWSCKDDTTFQGKHDPEVIKTYRNDTTSGTKMDSLSSINLITKQKLTEIYELSSLFTTKYNDSLMQDILFSQIKSYFLDNDSLQIHKLLQEMDSLKVFYVEVRNVNPIEKDSITPDSMRLADFSIRYYSKDKKLIDSIKKSAKYILKKEPKKFKHEFIFYFLDLQTLAEKEDSLIFD